MANQYSNYSASSIDGFNALLNSLPSYAPAPLQDTPNNKNSKYDNDSYKISNNKYPDCPALMEDGRAFTDYRSSCYIDNMIRVENKIQNSYDYRQFLIRNGESIMNESRLYNIQKTSCQPCDAKPINLQNICETSRESVNCFLNDANGVGTSYKAVPLPPSDYANRLSESRDFYTF